MEAYIKIIPKKLITDKGEEIYTYDWFLYEENGKIAPEHFYHMTLQQLYVLFFNDEVKDPVILETKKQLVEEYGSDEFLDNFKQNQEFFLRMISILNEIVIKKQNIIDETDES